MADLFDVCLNIDITRRKRGSRQTAKGKERKKGKIDGLYFHFSGESVILQQDSFDHTLYPSFPVA